MLPLKCSYTTDMDQSSEHQTLLDIHFIYYKGHHRRLHLSVSDIEFITHWDILLFRQREIGVGLHRKLVAKFPLYELDDACHCS